MTVYRNPETFDKWRFPFIRWGTPSHLPFRKMDVFLLSSYWATLVNGNPRWYRLEMNSMSGWWLTYHSETYESHLGWWNSTFMKEYQSCSSHHQPDVESFWELRPLQVSSEKTTLLWRWWAARGCWSSSPVGWRMDHDGSMGWNGNPGSITVPSDQQTYL